MYCIVLYCIVLYSILFYSILFYCILLYSSIYTTCSLVSATKRPNEKTSKITGVYRKHRFRLCSVADPGGGKSDNGSIRFGHRLFSHLPSKNRREKLGNILISAPKLITMNQPHDVAPLLLAECLDTPWFALPSLVHSRTALPFSSPLCGYPPGNEVARPGLG